jgi:ferredoxin
LMIDDVERVLEPFRAAGVDTLLACLGGAPCSPSI